MVLQEYKAEGDLTSTLLAVVEIYDALALTIFSFAEPIALIKAKGSGELSLVIFITEVVGPLATNILFSKQMR